MNQRSRAFVSMLALGLFPLAISCSQSPGYSPQEASPYIRRIFSEAPAGLLPSGDTLVTWNTSPILYHTANRRGDTVTTGMLRNDPLRGRSTVIWSAGRPESFSASWTSSKESPVTVKGSVTTHGITITGTRDTLLALPSTAWAVADYGMEDLLLPAFDHLSPGTTSTLAVLRPYGLKWDTVSVSAASRAGFTIVTWTEEKDAKEWLVLQDPVHILWIQRSDQDMERRPLEGTALFSEFERARKSIGSLK